MELGLNGKTAIVTGGTRGLGLACATSLGREGVRIIICGRDELTLKNALDGFQSNGIDASGVVADIMDPDGASQVYEYATKQYGVVDILVNNVGGSRGAGGIMEISDLDWLETFELNLFGSIRLTRLVVPDMRQRKWGRVICIGSIYGRELGGGMTYMTAKAALMGFTKHLSNQLAPDNVLVNTVHPGSIAHPGGGWQRRLDQEPEAMKEFIETNLPLGRFGRSEELGDFVCFLASEKASLITGTALNVDGGQSYSLL